MGVGRKHGKYGHAKSADRFWARYTAAALLARRARSNSEKVTVASESTASAYRREGDHTLIEIRLREIRQLFHTLDPAPFREKDLDEGAEDYLIEACREAGSRRPLRLIVYLPATEAESDAARCLPDAVHNYFAYREHQARADMLRLLRYGAASFAGGILFLFVCLALRSALSVSTSLSDPALIGEGLLILGSVAMWRPAEALLYDWWPLASRRTLLRRLAAIPIEVRGAA